MIGSKLIGINENYTVVDIVVKNENERIIILEK